jgi:hypothetical protein
MTLASRDPAMLLSQGTGIPLNPLEFWRSDYGVVADISNNLTTWTGEYGTVLTPSGSGWTFVPSDVNFKNNPCIKSTTEVQHLASSLGVAQPFTIVATAIFDTFTGYNNLFDNSSGSGLPRCLLQVQSSSFWMYAGTSDLTTGLVASTSTLYRLCAVYNGNTNSLLRANGTQSTGGEPGSIGTSSLASLSIGELTQYGFKGRISNVAVYARALSVSEMQQYEAWATGMYT